MHPSVRSSQIVGISATGRRRRRALATSSIASSKPASDSIPTSCTKARSYALKELVASWVPTRANQYSDTPARRENVDFTHGASICRPPGMYRLAAATTTPRSTSRASASTCVGVVGAVGHRDDHDLGRGVLDSVANRVRGAATESIERRHDPRIVLCELLYVRPGRVVDRVVYDQDLARQCDRVEQPVETRDELIRPRCRRG